MTQETKLEPCPLCGRERNDPGNGGPLPFDYEEPARIRWRVYCWTCGADGPGKPTEEEAIAAWNRRAPLSCGESEASEDAHALRESLAQEIRGVLRARNCWAPERASDLIVAVARALDSAMMLAETYSKAASNTPGSPPVADAEETTPLVTFDKRCADMLADEVAALVRLHVIDSRSPAADALLDYRSPPSTPRADRLAALEHDLEKCKTALEVTTNSRERLWSKLQAIESATPPPARPFPTEEECYSAAAEALGEKDKTVLFSYRVVARAVRSLCLAAQTAPSIGDSARDELWCHALTKTLDARQIEAVTVEFNRLRDLAALPAQTTSGTESGELRGLANGREFAAPLVVKAWLDVRDEEGMHHEFKAFRDGFYAGHASRDAAVDNMRRIIARESAKPLPAAAPEPEREHDEAAHRAWIEYAGPEIIDAMKRGDVVAMEMHDALVSGYASGYRAALVRALETLSPIIGGQSDAHAKTAFAAGFATIQSLLGSPLPQSPQAVEPPNAH